MIFDLKRVRYVNRRRRGQRRGSHSGCVEGFGRGVEVEVFEEPARDQEGIERERRCGEGIIAPG